MPSIIPPFDLEERNYRIEEYYPEDKEIEDAGILENYYPLIGEFLVTFSHLEFAVNFALKEILSHSDQLGYQVLATLQFSKKVQLFFNTHLALVSALAPSKKVTLRAIKKRLQSAAALRNVIAHADWSSLNQQSFVKTRITIDHEDASVDFLAYKITPEKLREKINLLDQLIEDLDNFTESAFEDPRQTTAGT